MNMAERLRRRARFETCENPESVMMAAAEYIEQLQDALRFYADPGAWKKLHDPEDCIIIPDFYDETSFGDTAKAALL